MMKRRLVALLSLLVVGLLAACAPVAAPSSATEPGAPAEQAEGPRRGGTLNVGLMQGLQTLDPQSTTAHPTPHVALTIWEGLFAYGQNFEPVPELAESWSVSDDQMTWTFKVREGVKFHNGKEMTAEDVKASLDRWKTVSPRAGTLGTLTEVRVADPYTVELVFSEPMGDIL